MQTLALFTDAYRELNARKLFWLALVISGLVVVSFALVGITETGLRLVVWDIPAPFNTTLMSEETFYKLMFLNLGVGFWLTWLAAILALVTTASIIPDFIAGGSIDLVLSRPIGRVRLFLTKYATGLLFVALQVTVFSAAAFFVLGLRGGAWEPAVFLAIPLVVLFFSYLYCVCALLGLITRSTIAALLLTLLFWFLIFSVHATESSLLGFKLASEQQVERYADAAQRRADALERLRESDPDEETIERWEQRLAEQREQLADSERTLGQLTTAHRITMGVKTALPKTAETVGMLERWLIEMVELPEAEMGPEAHTPFGHDVDMTQLERDVAETVRARSWRWIIGTSLAFEAFVLAIGAWIFARRDF
jgi:ABC-type transport system involved in multi-copper enzyme maturation permease subunit